MQEARWRSRAALIDGGLARHDVDGLLRKGAARSVVRGVLLPADSYDDLWQRCGAALTTERCAAISRRTAATAHRFPWLPDSWLSAPAICLDAPPADGTRRPRRGIDRKVSELPPEDLASWNGLAVTSVARTAVDLARFEQRNVVIPIIDGLLTQERCTRDELLACTDRMVHVRHVRTARKHIALAREGVGSPRETHMRLRIVDAGFPEPDVNLLIKSGTTVLAQGDLGYWRWLIWIEYDGVDTHEQRWFDGRDQSKDRWVRRRGWEVMRVTNADYYRPATFFSELTAAIEDAPGRIAAMDPNRSPEVAAAQHLLGFS